VDLGLRDRVAVVTGASRGIGRAIVEELVAEGVRVVAGARDVEALSALPVTAVAVDLSTPEGPATLVAAALSTHGAVDLLVNNVGSARFSREGFCAVTDEDWEWHFQTNFMSAVRATRAALPSLGERRGTIVNVSSINATRPGESVPAYSALKAALNNLTRALAVEYADRGVRAVTVSPGLIDTELQSGPDGVAGFLGRDRDEHLARSSEGLPFKRMGSSAEIAATVAFLLSDRSSYTSGAEIVVDGAYLAA
jgi:NAD(P)-dependent dehydrogenase (short-subunit alcohol dehydrogenase family)